MRSKSLLGCISAGTTFVFLGISILASGGFAAFFAHPARISIAIVTCLLMGASLLMAGNLNPVNEENRGNRWVLSVLGVLGVLLTLSFFRAQRFWILDRGAMRWTGVALFAIGGIVRIWPVRVLGRRSSGLVAIQEGHTLVTDGIYRWIRNPTYPGLLINSLGWAFAFRLGVGLIIVGWLLIPLLARLRSGEGLLLKHFGEEYAAHCRQT